MERIEPGEHQPTIWAVDPTPGEYAAKASNAMFGPVEPLIEDVLSFGKAFFDEVFNRLSPHVRLITQEPCLIWLRV